MKTRRLLAGLAAATLLCAGSAPAQTQVSKLLVTLNGTRMVNNAAGQTVSRPFNNSTLLWQYATANGLSSIQSLGLVYHINGSDLGDTIEIVDTTSGAVLATPIGLYFGEDQTLGRMALTNSIGTQVRKIQYVYTSQNSHSLGAALLTEVFPHDAQGNTTTAFISGPFEYLIMPDNTHVLQVVSGTLVAAQPVNFGSGQ